METLKIRCPEHGIRHIKIRHYNGPRGTPRGEWHRCSKCSFKTYLQLSAMAAVTLAIYAQNLLVYIRILH